MDGLKQAIKKYAFCSDAGAVSDYYDCCEQLADQITRLIVLMERYGCEDGSLVALKHREPNPTKLRDAMKAHLYAQIDLAGVPETYEQAMCELRQGIEDLQAFVRPDGEYGQYLEHQRAAAHIVVACQNVMDCVPTLSAAFDNCSHATRAYLRTSYVQFSDTLARERKHREPDRLLPAATWRQLRRMLWDVCSGEYVAYVKNATSTGLLDEPDARADTLEYLGVVRKRKAAGRPADLSISALVVWADLYEVSMKDLARMLVEADLDRDRARVPKPSTAARIRKETKRLVTYSSNRAKKYERTAPVDI